MTTVFLPIVGSYFRPPAPALCKILAPGAALTLRAEPENEYDPNAIAVWMPSTSLPTGDAARQAMSDALSPYGYDPDSLLESPEWHLGYVPKELAADLRMNYSFPVGVDVPAAFRLAPNGKPQVEFSLDFPAPAPAPAA